MNEMSGVINDVLGEIDTLFSQIALLLKTAEGAMERHKWTNRDGATCYPRCTTDVDRSDLWIPKYFYRLFTSMQHPNVGLYIAIILKPDYWELDDLKIHEPIITAGAMDFLEGKTPENRRHFEHEDSTGHFYHPQPTFDGILCLSKATQLEDWEEAQLFIGSLVSLALPLVEIANAQELEDKVIAPILAEIEKLD